MTVLGVSGPVEELVELSTRGSNDLLLELVNDGAVVFGNVAARMFPPGLGATSLVARCPSVSKSMLFARKSVRFGA